MVPLQQAMRGKALPLPLARRIVADLMHATMNVPIVSVRFTVKLDRLVAARAALAERPGWATIFIKAFCIIARDEQFLRRFYMKWPWPHLYDLPRSVAKLAIHRPDVEDGVLLFLDLVAADEIPLTQLEAMIRHARTAPIAEIPSFRRMLRTARLWLPLRRAMWALAWNVGRYRANHFGTFGITTVAAKGAESAFARAPVPSLLSYGVIRDDHTVDMMLHFDHRVYDGLELAQALARMETTLNGTITDELAALAASQGSGSPATNH
jgi:hypothetical protein